MAGLMRCCCWRRRAPINRDPPQITDLEVSVLCKNSIEPSRGSVIVTEEPTKSLAAADGADSIRWCEAFWRNQPIVKTLVIPFPVVMRRECGERSAQGASPRTMTRFRHSSLIDRTKRSAYALQLGAWNGV